MLSTRALIIFSVFTIFAGVLFQGMISKPSEDCISGEEWACTDKWRKSGNVSFSVGREILDNIVTSRAYGKGLSLMRVNGCLIHAKRVLETVCLPGRSFSPMLCCSAIRSAIDDGNCLCEPHVHEGRLAKQFGRLVWLANICRPAFPLPKTLSDLSKMDICQSSIHNSGRGVLNPSFLGLSEEQIALTAAENLPKFHDLFEAPEPGPYLTGQTTFRLPRDTKSILSNAHSQSSTLAVEIFFPAGEGSTSSNPVLNQSGPFPLIAFSPGLGGKPINHHLLFENLASLGYIIVSQITTYHLGLDLDVKRLLAWKDDIADMLHSLVNLSMDPLSFLHNGVNHSRIAVGGHSVGGAMAIAAGVTAIEKYRMPIRAVIALAPACLILGQQCSVPYEYAPRLHGVQALFFVGSMDQVTPKRTAEFFISLLPEDTNATLQVIEGATHCLYECHPQFWKERHSECGKGAMSPMVATRVVMDEMRVYLDRTL